MSFLNKNSDYGKFCEIDSFYLTSFLAKIFFLLIFLHYVSCCCYHRIFSCSELSITTFHSFFSLDRVTSRVSTYLYTLYGFGPEPTKNHVQNMIKFDMFDHS